MYQRILVPVDGSVTSNRGLDEAVKLAVLTRARLRLVHVVDAMSYALALQTASAPYPVNAGVSMREAGEKILQQALARVASHGVEADTVLLESFATRVADMVTEAASVWKADLIVIGTHGRRGMGRWLLGSDAEQLVRTASVPVLLVRVSEP